MKKILLTIAVLSVIYVNFFSEKARLDREVKRLCAIDGGIKVYETVKLPASKFDAYGQVSIPTKNRAKPDNDYYWNASRVFMKKGNPEMWQSHITVYRRVDSKLLGESISYTRRGGDIPGPWHESSFMCPEDIGQNNLKKQIFYKE